MKTDYGRLLTQTDLSAPDFMLDGLSILDVGCGNGWVMTHPRFARALGVSGIDIDAGAMAERRKMMQAWAD
jgi:2-polyprenyl-3-methyl-5-hydroxy-6-metoxy-1,4-benzoquinol methylase